MSVLARATGIRSLVLVLRALLLVLPVMLTVYSVVDAVAAPRDGIQLLSKTVWVLVIIALPVAGAALWFWLGRPRRGDQRTGPRSAIGPDDDPGFLATLPRRRPS